MRDDVNHKLSLQIAEVRLSSSHAQPAPAHPPSAAQLNTSHTQSAATRPHHPPTQNKRMQALLAKAIEDLGRMTRLAESLTTRVNILEAHTGIHS